MEADRNKKARLIQQKWREYVAAKRAEAERKEKEERLAALTQRLKGILRPWCVVVGSRPH